MTETKKVYCKGCAFYSQAEYPSIPANYPMPIRVPPPKPPIHRCSKNAADSPIAKVGRHGNCEVINKNNDCPDFQAY